VGKLSRRIAGAHGQGKGPKRTTAAANRPGAARRRFEPLEPRWVLDGGPLVISEIMYHPASENVLEEYIELFNASVEPVDLLDWRIDDGVLYTFPDVTLDPGEYLVVAADLDAFSAVYPEVTNLVGGWDGRLSNSSEAIELIDAAGNRVDRVRYADEGDWGVREIGPNDLGHTGWIWASAHDGGGASLELINPAISNAYGQNWAASTEGGTPGAVNSAYADDIAPIILDVSHAPAIPRASDPVTVTARLRDEVAAGMTATLHYRLDGTPDFITVAMRDDGQNGDGPAGDGVYGAEIPVLDDGTVVEFYVAAADAGGLMRTCPAPVGPEEEQLANLLYQVNDAFDPDAPWVPGNQPIYYLIMTDAERAELADIGDRVGGDQNSNAQMNATFISVDGTETLVRYRAGVRNRGHGSRRGPPNNYRVNFVHDRPWKGVSALNINCRNTDSQLIGSVIHQMAGLVATEGAAVQVRVNGRDLAPSGSPTFGSYVALEALDSDFADNHFPGDGAGNAYKVLRSGSNQGDLRYEGENPDAYRDTYFKMTNEAEDDWSDLIHMTDVLNHAPEETYLQDVSRVIHVDRWLRYFALHALFSNYETGLYRGIGDDYAMYCGIEDPRFVLIPHDLDSILGLGGGSTTSSIFNYRGVNGLDRFFNHPDVITLYYATLLEMIETFFNPQVLDPLFDQVLGPWAPQARIDAMKAFVAARVENVLQQIPREFTVNSDLPLVDGYPRTSLSTIALSGTAHGADTRSVLVNGEPADWDPLTSTWQIVGPHEEPPGIVLSFRNGVSPDENYASTLDTELGSNDLTGNRGADETVQVDGSSGGAVLQGLLWFDDIFGDQPGQIPPDVEILDAALILNVTNLGNPLALHRMLQPWDEAANWGTFGGDGIQADGVEAAIDADTTASVPDTGTLSIDVTMSLRNWQADPASNLGWAMLPTGTNGVVFRSSEDPNLPGRPELRVVIDDGTVPIESGVKMKPGINRVLVRAFDGPDGTGNELARESIDVWYDTGGGTNLSGTLAAGNTVLDAASGPWHVTGDVTVPVGATLTIEPGTTLFFDQGCRITVNGRLVAEGTEYRRIRLSTAPGSGAAWNGLYFNSGEDNRLALADMQYATSGNQSISLGNSRLLIDDVSWSGTDETILNISDSSLIVRNSVFPGTATQAVSGHRLLASDPYMLFENNVFGVCTGEKQDVVDFSTTGSAAMPRFIGNTFLGGGDDALDLDGTDAYIEGNVFVNFNRNFDPAEGESYAISTGYDGPYSSHHVIVRNVFIDCDNAALVKDRSRITFENNTVIRCSVGISFDEPQEAGIDPGTGAYLDGNIFWQTPTPLAHYYVDDPTWGTTDITVNRSIIPAAYHGFGEGNTDEDPRLADPDGGDYGLLPGSPALGSGPAGLDKGAMVPGGASIGGMPPAITAATDAVLWVAGPGVTHYKFRLDGAVDWSDIVPVETPVQLAGLTDGGHTVAVIGRSAAGDWQDEGDAATVSWTVDTSLPHVRINEVLAVNTSAVEHEGAFPDLVELYNDAAQAIDLAGMGLSDDPSQPARYVFPAGTTIEPGQHLVLYADGMMGGSGIRLPFSLDGRGEGVYLYDSAQRGGGLLDAVEFGPQAADLSIGRIVPGGPWMLTQPTFGAANTVQRTGDPAGLKINEWLASGRVRFADDFVELYNPDPLPVPLAGLFLTDDPVARRDKHEIAPLSFIAGGGHTTFTADNDPEAGPDHLAFRLSAEKELIGLYDAGRNEIDKVFYFSQTTDVSQGRLPDGGTDYEFFLLPSPGLPNRSIAATTTAAIGLYDEWSYNDSGDDLGTAWREPSYDDSAWGDPAPGVFGWEDGSLPATLNTELAEGPVTYYFRKHFTIDADPQYVTLRMTTLIDDGAAFYLNGAPVWKLGVPDDPFDYLTPANRGVGDAAFEGPFTIPTDALVRGDNLLAVEVHQNASGNRDVIFGLSLEVTAPTEESQQIAERLELLDSLRITEIMYHPAGDGVREFIELQNVAGTTLDLTGLRFTEGVDFTFPPLLLEPQQYVAVVRDRAAFEAAYGPGINVAGQYADSLGNGGERLVLKLPWPWDAAVMRFEYDDAWYPATDGGGYALEIRDPTIDAAEFADAGSWQAARPSPGEAPLPPPAQVAGRYVFYNNSAFDGNDPAANTQDDLAIAPDKTPLLPGGIATREHYTSYGRGLNGVMVDLQGAAGPITGHNFRFHVGNAADPGSWLPAPPPTTFTVRPGGGAGGSDRVVMTWDDHAVENQWLQVTVLAGNLNLAEDDVFYFGNAVAESGNSASDARVTTIDLLLARNNPRNFLDPAPIDFPYDYNRDGRVNATDVLLARNNQTNVFDALKLLDLSTVLPAADLSPVAMAWLAEYAPGDPQSRTSTKLDAVEAVDKLLATYGF